MKYKMIISDYDGTLSETNFLPVETIEAIVRYKKAGGKFVLCSGRATLSADEILSALPVEPDAVITFQGADIRIDGKFVKREGLPVSLAAKICEDLSSFHRHFCAYDDEHLYYDSDTYKPSLYYLNFFPKEKILVDDMATFLKSLNGYVKKLNVMKYPDEDPIPIRNYVLSRYGDKVYSNSGAPIIEEIINKECTKYSASKFVADYFSIPESEVITIGDSSNDLMLLDFGFPIAVASGSEELKSKAKYIAPPIKEHPVKVVIDKILNGEDLI